VKISNPQILLKQVLVQPSKLNFLAKKTKSSLLMKECAPEMKSLKKYLPVFRTLLFPIFSRTFEVVKNITVE
jgi:uncharacterized protein YnzC (UPF0291/DUF896 family)